MLLDEGRARPRPRAKNPGACAPRRTLQIGGRRLERPFPTSAMPWVLASRHKNDPTRQTSNGQCRSARSAARRLEEARDPPPRCRSDPPPRLPSSVSPSWTGWPRRSRLRRLPRHRWLASLFPAPPAPATELPPAPTVEPPPPPVVGEDTEPPPAEPPPEDKTAAPEGTQGAHGQARVCRHACPAAEPGSGGPRRSSPHRNHRLPPRA